MLNYFIKHHPHVSVFLFGIFVLALGFYLSSGKASHAIVTVGIGIIISSIALSFKKDTKGW